MVKSIVMLRPGLVSVTYRALCPREVIAACVEAKLEGVEWGGDVHVRPDDLKNARAVGQMTRDAGLEVAAYGSYWKCNGPFEPIVETAAALGAPLIRVWAGATDASEANESDWQRVTEGLAHATAIARAANVQVVTEFHGGTLTSSGQNALQLMQKCDADVQTLWQPLRRCAGFDAQVAENLADLRALAPYLSNVHVYEWADDGDGERQRLSLRGSTQWPRYVEELKRIGGARCLLLEFVPDDDPAVLAREAAALREWLETPSENFCDTG